MKFGNHKYDMTSDLQKLLFTSIPQNNFTSYKNVPESVFEIKTFESLKEVMNPFLNVRNFIKNFKTVMVAFFSIKSFKSRKAVVEFSLSFKNFQSRQKVNVSVPFQWLRFIKLSYDDQISWNNIFSVSSD